MDTSVEEADDGPPAKRVCLQAQSANTLELPATPNDDGSDFYNTPMAGHTPKTMDEDNHITNSEDWPSLLKRGPTIPGLRLVFDAASNGGEAKAGSNHTAVGDTVAHSDGLGQVVSSNISTEAPVKEDHIQEDVNGRRLEFESLQVEEASQEKGGENDMNTSALQTAGNASAMDRSEPESRSTDPSKDVPPDTAQDIQMVDSALPTVGEAPSSMETEIGSSKAVSGSTGQGIKSEENGLTEDPPITATVSQAADKDMSEFKTAENQTSEDINGLPLSMTAANLDSNNRAPGNNKLPINGAENGAQDNQNVEWEIDSSPIHSSSDSSSADTSSSDDDSDEDEDYAMLTPAEQARILMQGEGGSDDEGGNKPGNAAGVQLRTAHERPEEVIPKPDIAVTEDMKIEELGGVEGMVENTVLVKAKTSGEYQVLESGSVLCLENRSVVGVVGETLGRVQQPMYTIRFTNEAAIEEAGLSKGTTIFYVEKHSTFVFTQPLKAVKGSDASNFHDEEVGDDEMEFSDDEAEAEHKRRIKMRRQERRGARMDGNGCERSRKDDDGRPRGESVAYSDTTSEINYDDAGGDEDGYTPLSRPTNLHEIMGPREAPLEGHFHGDGHNDRGHRGSRGSRGRGRGGDRRGRGRGEGRGRGGWEQRSHDRDEHRYPPARTYFSPSPSGVSIAPYPQYPMAPPLPPQPQSAYQHQPTRQHDDYQPHHQHSPQPHSQPNPYLPPRPSFPNPRPQHTSSYGSHHQNQYQPSQHPPPHPHSPSPISPLPYQQYPSAMPPPGSHINPAFFAKLQGQQQQQSHYTAPQQQPGQLQHQQQQGNGYGYPSQQQSDLPTKSPSFNALATENNLSELLRRINGGVGGGSDANNNG